LSCRLCGLFLLCALVAAAGIFAKGLPKKKAGTPSALDEYVRVATEGSKELGVETSPGAIWSPTSRLTDLGRDLRASQVNDIVTIIVSESVNAVATGGSSSQRSSSANASVSSLAGKPSPVGALANLAGLSGDQKLNGQGTTTRASTLNAAVTARVVRVLPGGMLLVEGDKSIQVNSEQQVISVRGVIRAVDVTTSNTVASTQIANMEVRVNGKGIVGDAIRRPNILYRLLLGVLPF
jgi:flagellar L-ring protein precursor FlgH